MDYTKGERVRHPGMPEWGLGKVLENSRDYKVCIFFAGDGRKTLSLKHVEPVKISGEEARSPVLDHLSIKEGGVSKYQSLQISKELFLKNYPDGFYDPAYLKGERNQKVAAHEMALSLLGPKQMQTLLDQKDYEGICKRVMKVVNATNLIFPNEKLALRNGLKDSKNMEVFSEKLYQLLYGKEDVAERFISFARTLVGIKAAKWAILSYFLFIVFPDKYIFLKPIITQITAEISAFEINYRPDLNWRTYQSVLEFSEYFRSELNDFKPRDMIDIQSFMWGIGTNK
jgi:hypothetical protein